MAHIVHIAKWFPPAIGGIERAVEFLADAAREAGHEVTVVCCEKVAPPGRTVTSTGVVVERVRSLGVVNSMPIAPGLPAAIRRAVAKADIVHTHEPFPISTLTLLAPPRPRRLVISWHGDIIKQQRLKPYAEWFQNQLASHAKAIICTTERMGPSSPVLRRHLDQIRVVPYMVDMTPFDAIRGQPGRIEATRQKWGGRFMFSCGRLIYYKGYEFLIDALAGTDMRAIISGEGPLRAELEARARERGVADQIVLAGELDDETVRDLYFACEFLAFPSVTQGEAFGIVQMEAMAAGRPVVNTLLPTSVPAVSLDGQTGLTVPSGDANALRDAMMRLWHDDALREKFAAAALPRVRDKFERSRVIDRLLAVYDEVLAG